MANNKIKFADKFVNRAKADVLKVVPPKPKSAPKPFKPEHVLQAEEQTVATLEAEIKRLQSELAAYKASIN